MKKLKKGDFIRLKVRTITGWKGVGIVKRDMVSDDDIVDFYRIDGLEDDLCCCLRHECSKIRNTYQFRV